MNILHIIESLDAGGAERVLLNLISLNTDPTIKHEVLCLAGEGALKEEFEDQGIKIHSLNKARGFDPRVIWRVKKVLEIFKPQLLHTHLFSGNLWGRLISVIYGIPCVMSVQNADSWIGGWRVMAEKMLVDVPELTIAASKSALEHRDRYGLKMSKAMVVNNGLTAEPKPEERQKMRESWGLNEDDRVVGVLARCVPQKDPALFMSIAHKLIEQNKNLYFVWAGGGSEVERFKSSHEHIKFLGHQEDTMAVLAAYDILLSTSEREGFSLSLIEGMWAGLPILATKVPGNEEMFEELNPELLIAEDLLDNFVLVLQQWLDDSEQGKEVGQALALAAKEKFSAEGMAEKYQLAYKGLGL